MTDDVTQAMPALRSAFDSLKRIVGEGRFDAAGASLFGDTLLWGEELREIFVGEGREALAERDPLTRFFVCRFRGSPDHADLTAATPATAFLWAFTAFPYLDSLLDSVSLGDHVGYDEDGHWMVRRLLEGEAEGSPLRAERGERGWRFDLMPLYQCKAAALDEFLEREFGGDFEAFLWRYVADHDLPFDADRAWRPVGAAAA